MFEPDDKPMGDASLKALSEKSQELQNLDDDIKSIEEKIDAALDVLNSFTIMLAEDDEDLEENYEFDNDQTWVPNEEDFWQNDEDDEI